MARGGDRVDGWKSIGGHFGRDRTTAMRWAGDRGLPVHFLPGGKTRTVYAFRSELDAWAQQAVLGEPLKPLEQPAEAPVRTPVGRSILGAAVLAVAIACAAGAAVVAMRHVPTASPAVALPRDPATAQLFVRAREDWASRSAAGLARSIREFQEVVERDPLFAPAFADLADAYLLEEENGALSDDEAFTRAGELAAHALQLDPTLAAARRALGFVFYWQRHDRARAGADFRQALAIDPTDAQTHFWYANILADNGEDAAATREFEHAQLLDPGSIQIAIDHAWASWSAGDSKDALDQLTAIMAAHPGSAEALDCLAFMRLGAGDFAGYLAAADARAKLRGNPDLLADVARIKAAAERGGPQAGERAFLDAELGRQATAPYPDHSTAAFLASTIGDRAALLQILTLAEQRGEIWGSAGYTRRIRQRWIGDAQVSSLLARRAPPAVE